METKNQLKKMVVITIPIILSVLCVLLWLLEEYTHILITGDASYVQTLITIFTPIYMICVFFKRIGTFRKLDIKVFLIIYAITRIVLVICYTNFCIFTARDDLASMVDQFTWFTNTTFLIVGWIVIKTIKTLYYHIKK